jgi:small subunit ribosomal protein S16
VLNHLNLVLNQTLTINKMIKLRLSRGGRTKLPFYQIIATNSTSPRDSKFIEKIGTYNPLLADGDTQKLTINKERAEYWISVGAKPTEKVAKFLIALGIKGADKYKPNFAPKAKGSNLKKKAQEKLAKQQ